MVVVPYAALRIVLIVLMRLLWRVRVENLDQVPRTGGFLIAANHLSFIDSLVIPVVVPRRVAFLAKAEYFEGRGVRGALRRWWFRGIGAVPVRRGSHGEAMASLQIALQVLRDGDGFGIYPEGTRSRDGRVYRGRTGVAWLALASGAPVVPVGLTGTDRVQPVGARLPRIAPVTVRFGAPLLPQDYQALPAGAARRRMTDDVMAAVAQLSGQEVAAGYSPASGQGPA
ncbi:MAG TPA: lysophospholipid acyltransferase family protein [Actinomycetales bacterium]|nr:lysophospholipid acyltransferase family protein [Actinomycetales bacterium]